MKSTQTDKIKEIADQLDCGFRAFIHKTTEQTLFIPDDKSMPDIDFDYWSEELEELDNNFTDYHEIPKWSSSEAFEIMSEFTNQLTDKNLQSQLFDALRKNKPFRRFKFIIDNSYDFRQEWFDFKTKWQEDYVAKQLNRLKQTDE